MESTYAELLKKLEALKQQTEAARKRELKGVIARLREAIATYSIQANELYPDLQISLAPTAKAAKKPRKKAPPKIPEWLETASGSKGKKPAKYRDPETGKTWSGMGHEPGWIKGKKREDFLITK